MKTGDIVLLSEQQCYKGCVGAVVERYAQPGGRPAMCEVDVPGLGRVIRKETDLRVLDRGDLEDGSVVGNDPRLIVASQRLASARACFESAVYRDDNAEAARLADEVVRLEETVNALQPAYN